MKSNEMYIRLDGMKYFAFHGVLPQEAVVGAEYTVNLRLKTDFTHAAETDELDGTINYASVHEAVKSEMATPSKLLEHVAYRIAQRLFHDFSTLEKIKIELFKQNPPMGAQGNAIGIEVTYTKAGKTH